MKSFENKLNKIKIGTQCVHMASQKKHHDRIFIKQNDKQLQLFIFLTMPTMQLLDLKCNSSNSTKILSQSHKVSSLMRKNFPDGQFIASLNFTV